MQLWSWRPDFSESPGRGSEVQTFPVKWFARVVYNTSALNRGGSTKVKSKTESSLFRLDHLGFPGLDDL